MKKITVVIIAAAVIMVLPGCRAKNKAVTYEPTFASLEQANPVPEWFKDAKFCIYFHLGVYSVPAYSNEWYPRNMYRAGTPEHMHHIETYGEPDQWPYDKFITGGQDKKGNFVQFAPELKSEGGNFDPAEWAKLFADAGARFAGPVAEHHDGFSMWDSKVNPWNARDMGPELDLVGILTKEIRKHGIKIVLSMHHAFNITGFYEDVPLSGDPELRKLYGQQGKEKNEAMWLKKYGEAIYCTRSWEKYGEGPTKMGAGHGVFTAPAEGTAQDVRYTRSKDNKTLYAILLGWDEDQEVKVLSSLASDSINLASLKEVSLINGEAGSYLTLQYKQDEDGLVVTLPEKTLDELAYVLRLTFEGAVPALKK